MTRVNTNVGSLIAQTRLNRTQDQLQTSLTRLSTGLRINSGKDDPAGLIASESLRSDITAINKALSNTQRAGQIIATADSALGQVSSLLNDMRGLITEAANNGALSDNEIAANQLQLDASLEAINRVSQSATFQGRKLLDGSLDFLTSGTSNFNKLSDVRINQANLGSSGSVSVSVNVATAATKASLTLNVPASTQAANAKADLVVTNAAAQATGTVNVGAESFTITAVAGQDADGLEGNAFNTVNITYGAGSASATYDAASNTLNVSLTQASGTATVTNLKNAITAGGDFTVSGGTGSNTITGNGTATMSGGRDAGSSTISVVSDTSGTAANGVTVTLSEDNSITNNTAEAAIVGGNIEVKVKGTVSRSAIASAINNLSGYSASITASSGDQSYIQASDTPPGASTLGGGGAASGGLTQDVVFQLAGKAGSEVINLKAGSSVSNLAAAVNLVKDSTGVEATVDGNDVELTSTLYGSSAFVNLEVINEATGGTITSNLGGASKGRDTGSDIVATVNGLAAKGDGNVLSINTSTLSFSTSVEAAYTGASTFNITGGGALFQLGPSVVSSQQARLGIASVNTASLGGTNGRLYQLGSGETFNLKTDSAGAAKVINEVIDKVASLRGRLGAFQRTTLESNSVSLSDTLSNLTEAESSIRDADFAKETAGLTRAQILVQSGTAVLGIANQSSQSVLGLLR
ncbi:MAG: flagellin [Planctomycetes bacterium]|nr:flagellin [Planctomycetota bacterium]